MSDSSGSYSFRPGLYKHVEAPGGDLDQLEAEAAHQSEPQAYVPGRTKTAVEIPAAMREEINTSLSTMRPLIVAYRDADGNSKPSFRGSAHVHSPTQIAFWVRDKAGGLPRALGSNDELTFVYRDGEGSKYYRLQGVGHVIADGPLRDRIYEACPLPERKSDPERKGVAVVADICRISGLVGDDPILIEPDAG